MKCIVCGKTIERSFGSSELNGNYCEHCYSAFEAAIERKKIMYNRIAHSEIALIDYTKAEDTTAQKESSMCVGLYKGKTKSKEWIQGNLVENLFKRGEYRIGHFGFEAGIRHTEYKVVDQDTICEAILGCFDRNGVQIFEGDILQGEDYPFKNNNDYNYFAEVCRLENSPSFGLYVIKNPLSKVNGISHGIVKDMEDWDPRQWEVIGNIHDEID